MKVIGGLFSVCHCCDVCTCIIQLPLLAIDSNMVSFLFFVGSIYGKSTVKYTFQHHKNVCWIQYRVYGRCYSDCVWSQSIVHADFFLYFLFRNERVLGALTDRAEIYEVERFKPLLDGLRSGPVTLKVEFSICTYSHHLIHPHCPNPCLYKAGQGIAQYRIQKFCTTDLIP